jgi:hypothetical protein
VATFQTRTEALLGDKTDTTGEISTLFNTYLASADFTTSLSIDSSRRFVVCSRELLLSDFKADRALSARCPKYTPRGWIDATLPNCASI